jgi:hypothetical protein
MATIQISNLPIVNSEVLNGANCLTDKELDSIKGGVLSLLVLSFGAGYAVGTAINRYLLK